MARRRRWDDPWQRYPASVPIPADGGLETSRKRGPIAQSWWSRRFIEVLESYGLGARMQRGRRYARSGQVLTMEVRTSVIAAQVQGSRPTPYLVTLSLPEPSRTQWEAIDASMASKVGFAARLLGGEVPPDLEGLFDAAGVALFPPTWSALRAECSCPDWENPCKHIAAVLYLFADRLDDDPWLLLAWRGRTREQVLDGLAVGPTTPDVGDHPVAPWWPFGPGALPDLAEPLGGVVPTDFDHREPSAVLAALDDLDVTIRDTPITGLLGPAYEALAEDDASG
jgi:hypothetical protein